MAVAFGAAGTLGAAASGTSITPALPAFSAGAIFVGFVASKNNATHTWPAGWTKVTQTNSGASWTVSWAWRVAQTGDTAPSVTWTGSVANTGQIWTYTGADNFWPIGVVGTAATGTTSPHTSTAITTTRDASLAIYIDAGSANTVLTAPSTYTQNVGNGSATSVTADATGSKTVTTKGTSTGAISTTGGAAAWVQQQVEILAPMPPDPDQQITDLPDPHLRINPDRLDRSFISNWLPRFQFPSPDNTKIFRPHQRSLPPQPYPPNYFQSWTESFFIPMLPLPYGEQVTDLAPGQRLPEQVQLHSWTWSYNLNLIGKDQLPPGSMPGEPVYDLPPSQKTPEQIQLHSWTWNYNLNLIGQDRMIVGKQVYDLTLSQRLPELPRSWTLDLSTTTLFPVTPAGPLGVVANQYSWPLPQPGAVLQQAQQPYNLALLVVPPDLTKIFRPHQRSLPDQPVPPLLQQSVFRAWPTLYTVTVPPGPLGVVANQYDWPVPKAPQQPALSITASYNPNLIGQDKLPTGEQVTDLAPRDYQRQLQTWIQNVNLALVTTPVVGPLGVVANQYDWSVPRPQAPAPPSWTASYNLNLIGQDKLPTGEQFTELPPHDFPRLFQTWIQNVSLALTPQSQFRQYDWPTPKGYEPDWRRSWEWHYNLNLIGQDQLPPGKQSYDLAPRDYQRQLQTWIQNISLALITPSSVLPLTTFSQYDWPIPRPYPPAPPSWTASYNLNLIGQDQLPTGKPVTALPPLGIAPALQTWITNVSLALVVPPIVGPLGVVANQYDWPNPRAPLQLTSDWPQQNLTIKLPPPPAVTELHQNPFFITMGRLSQLGNLPS